MNNKTPENASRRNFIRNASLASAGFFIVPRHVLGRGFVAPSDKLNIGSIGAGGKGQSDIANFYKSGNANIVALCDVDDRQSKKTREKFPKATYYKDFREMLEKEKNNIDAVSVSIPDHCHAVPALMAMQMGKHVYVQKPLTHDIYEARVLTEAARRYKVVTQMGNQGSSGDGVRQMQDWYNAGLIGDAHTIRCWTNRPVWPQGNGYPTTKDQIPPELDWNLWLGPTQFHEYHTAFVPFNWRGYWDFGTGALGDMGCHIIDPPFKVVGLGYPSEVECSVADIYEEMWTPAYHPESCPPASSIKMKFPGKNGKPDVKLTWMDGNIRPERPEELGPDEPMGNSDGGAIIEGTKGKMMCGCYGADPTLLPTSRTKEVGDVKQTVERVPGGQEGHYAQWVNACIAGYGNGKTSSHFDYAGPLTETVLFANLALRSWNLKDAAGKSFPGRKKLLWDATNMKITNFDDANQFVRRAYRDGYSFKI
ncbi:Gfo/Idh/MocA family oxidoreductase [Ilyomonas limi]|uniref:Gfo/Idh/MocA family oxidoreductase n=1 Tax=Ilyomonas limi TaxID=2575867 RepID=A0A4U3L150_9BACT|nr:Gfo/Idh/MocA family oxidoreductase [Ilyomonas limi]TKK68482.1 Gfo/Idh/MocA family oxidoreductase [Ilyomonas limi]